MQIAPKGAHYIDVAQSVQFARACIFADIKYKMKNIFKKSIVTLIILLLTHNLAIADTGPAQKCGRGLANLSTGWVEIFTTMHENMEAKNSIFGAISAFPLGCFKAGVRMTAGLYEIITFPFPFPNKYQPIVLPEFVEIKRKLSPFDHGSHRLGKDPKKRWDLDTTPEQNLKQAREIEM